MLNGMGNRGSNDRFYFLGLQNHCSHEIKRLLLLERKAMTNLDNILKTRHHFADKGPYSQRYGFASNHVQMWELDHNEGWKVKVKITQLYLTLFCDPMDYTVHGILQARILEWVAYPFCSVSSRLRNWTGVSCISGRFFTNWGIREGWVLKKWSFWIVVLEKTLENLLACCAPWGSKESGTT